MGAKLITATVVTIILDCAYRIFVRKRLRRAVYGRVPTAAELESWFKRPSAVRA